MFFADRVVRKTQRSPIELLRRRCAETLLLAATLLTGCAVRPVSVAPPHGSAMDTAGQQTCTVIGVTDGDTFTCRVSGRYSQTQTIVVRLDQIDAPEKGQPFSQVPRQYLSSLVFGSQVRLAGAQNDRYGRRLARVWTEQGLDVNREMVRSGYAWAYREYLREPDFLVLENEARQASRGLWRASDPVRPSVFRRGRQRASSTETPNADAAMRASRNQHSAMGTAGGAFACGTKRFCTQMRSCAEALFHLRQCGATRLDGDGDGVPCETLCQ